MSNSTNVETNVVQMRFDNKRFEKNVQQTIDSVDKLKKELKFDDTAKSFKTLEENTKKVDFSPIVKGIEKVQASFSFLDRFAIQVYDRISNKAINVGKQIASSISTQGMSAGFRQYEDKMNSFKTIQAAASKDFSDAQINRELEKLTDYANKTIYSLSDMTTNISKFTNAGVKLDRATKAIMGVSNEAARSGANAQEASRAMYNFAQSLSVGFMQTIDWKSIENANMATQEFKQQLAETGVEMKTLTKAADGTYRTLDGTKVTVEGLRESLSKKWLTSEVLIKTLEKYADETTEIGKASYEAAKQVNTFHKMMDVLRESVQTNWSLVWETVIGNLKEATGLYTKISDKVGGFVDKLFAERIEVLKTWKAHSGRQKMLEALSKIMSNLGKIFKQVGDAYRSVFPKKTSNDIMRITQAFEDFAKKTEPSSKTLYNIFSAFRALFSAISIVREAITAFRKTFGRFFIKILKDALTTIFGVTGSLDNMLTKIRVSVKENKTFYKAFEAIVNVLEWVYDILKKVAGAIWDFAKSIGNALKSFGGIEAFKNWFDGLVDAIKNFDIAGVGKSIWKLFKTIGKTIDKAMAATFDFYTPLKNKIIETKDKIVNSKVVQWVVGVFESMVDGIQKAFDKMKSVKTDGADHVVNETKNKFSVLDKIVSFFKKAWEVIKGIFNAIWPVIKSVFKSLGTGIQMLWEGITSNIKNSDMGDAGGLLGGIGIVALVTGIRSFIKEMRPMLDFFKIFSKGGALSSVFNLLGNLSKFVKAKILKEIALSLLMLVGALFLLCTLPQDKLAGATITMGILFQGITSVFKTIEGSAGDINSGGDAKVLTTRLFGIAAMIGAISIAIVVLTIAMRKIAKLDTEDIVKGMIAIMFMFRIIESSITGILSMGQKVSGSEAGKVDIAVKGVGSMIKALGKAMVYIAAAVWILMKAYDPNRKGAFAIVFIVVSALLGIVGFIMTQVMKLTKESESWSTAISGFATIIAIGWIIKQFAKALMVIIAGIAVLSYLITHNVIDGAALGMTMTVMLGAISLIMLTLVSTIKIAKSMQAGKKKAGVLQVAALFGVIVLFINALSVLFTVLSLIPNNWAMSGVMALGTVSSAIVLILLAISKLMKNSQFDTSNKFGPKGIAIVMGTITASILALVIATSEMAKSLGGSGSTKAILLLVGIATAISGIIVALGHFQKFARGFDIFTKGLAAFGIAAAGFATATVMIIMALKQISKMSDAEIAAVGKNMKKVTTAIATAADQIIGLIMALVNTVVGAAIGTAVTTLINSSKQIINGLLDLLDILLKNAPQLVNKLLQVAVEILSQFERSCGPVIAQLISTVATIISEVARAITDNAPKIVKAIDDVITAITTLVVGSVAKMLGLDEFKGAVKMLIRIIKPFTAVLLGMFAINKFKKNVKVVETVLTALKAKLIAFKNTVKRGQMGDAWRDLLGITQLNDIYKNKMGVKELGTLGEQAKFAFFNPLKALPTLLKGAGIGTAIGAVLGSIGKAFIDAKADSIDATTTWVEDTDKEFGKLVKSIEKNRDEIKEKQKNLQEAIYGVDTNYDTSNQKIGKLLDIIDQKTGKIKEGKEEEASNLVNDINSQLGEQLVIENNVLKMLDAQGKAREFELEQLQNIIATEKLRDKLAEKKKRKEEIEKEGGELDTAKKNKEEAEQVLKNLPTVEAYDKGIDALKAYAERLFSSDSIDASQFENFEQRLKAFDEQFDISLFDWAPGSGYEMANLLSKGGFDRDIKNYRENISEVYQEKEAAYKVAENSYNDLIDQINEYYEAEKALEEGNKEAIKRWNVAFTGIYKANLTDKQKEVEANRLVEEVKDAADNARESVYNRITADYEAAKQYYTDLGKLSELAKLETSYQDYNRKFNETQQGKEVVGDNGLTKSDLYTKISDWAGQGLKRDEVVKKMKSLGVDAGEGYLDGYEDLVKAKSGKTGEEVIDSTVTGTQIAQDSASPSKVFADEVGRWAGEGFLVGMENAVASYNASSMIQGLVSKLQSSILPAIAGLTGNSIPFAGVTPVNFGLNQNGSDFSTVQSYPFSADGVLPYMSYLENINDSLNRLTERMVQQTDGIIDEVRGLRGDVSELGTRMANMEMRLDGDALVGQLTPRINDSLVRYSSRVGRGI